MSLPSGSRTSTTDLRCESAQLHDRVLYPLRYGRQLGIVRGRHNSDLERCGLPRGRVRKSRGGPQDEFARGEALVFLREALDPCDISNATAVAHFDRHDDPVAVDRALSDDIHLSGFTGERIVSCRDSRTSQPSPKPR